MSILKRALSRALLLSLTAILFISTIPANPVHQCPSTEGTENLTLSHPWPMFRHDLNHTGRSPYDTSGNNGQLLWKFQTDDHIGFSSPAIASDSSIYIGSQDGNLYALFPNGTLKWKYATGNHGYKSISSPAIGADGTIHFGAYDENIYALHPNGSAKWTFPAQYIVSSSPAVSSEGIIYIGSHDDNLYAINPDGSQKWVFAASSSILSSPAVALDGTIYVGSWGGLYAINPNGNLKWFYPVHDIIWSSPSIAADGTVYVGSYSSYNNVHGHLYAFYPNGTLRWKFLLPGHGTHSSPAIDLDGTIYIGATDYYYNFFAINPNGTQKWNFSTKSYVHSSPAISSDGTIHFGSYDKNVYALYPNGSLKWKYTAGDMIGSSPSIAPDGTIYIGCSDGALYAIGHGEEGPVADAGPDQTVYEGEVVQFNGSGVSSQERLSINLTEPVRVHGVRTAVQQTSSMALNSQNHVLVAWADSRDGSPWALYFARSIDNGASFEPEIKLGEGIYWSYGSPRMAVDSSDTVYVVWVTLEDPDELISGIQISRSIDGGKTFEDPRWVNESVGAFRTEPDIAIGGNDTVLVAWQELREDPVDDDPQVCVARSTDGESFSPCVEISGPTSGGWSIGTISITRLVANQDEVYVGWRCDWYTEYQHYSAYVSGSSDGGVTFSEKVQVFVGIEDFDFVGLQSPALILSQDGILNLAWVGSLNETPDCPAVCDVSIFTSDDGGQTFESTYSINDNSSGQPIRVVTMALDNEGSVYVAWSRVADSRIFVDRSTDGGRTFGEDVELLADGPDESNFLGDIAFGSNSTFHLAWNSKDWPDSPDIYHSQGPVGLTSGNLTYEWDFDAAVDSDGNGNSTDDGDATGPTPTWVYGDNGDFTVTVKVTDENGNWDEDTMNVTVLNVSPKVSADYACTGGGPADILFRITGEKWHDVTFVVLEDGSEIYNETLVRVPGSPNEQMIGLEGFAMNGSRSYSVVAYYTPEDDPVNGQIWGATPAWIILRSGGNETARLHHTFNVRHPETWVWRVEDLESYLPSRECTFTGYASDLGSDDLTFSWDFGDGTTAESVHYNDGIGPDPYPSPEVNPIVATDAVMHRYALAGSFTVTLTVTDDDGGTVQVTLVIDV